MQTINWLPFQEIAKHCKKLKYLALNNVATQAIRACLSNCPLLDLLERTHCKGVNKIFLWKMKCEYPKVKLISDDLLTTIIVALIEYRDCKFVGDVVSACN